MHVCITYFTQYPGHGFNLFVYSDKKIFRLLVTRAARSGHVILQFDVSPRKPIRKGWRHLTSLFRGDEA